MPIYAIPFIPRDNQEPDIVVFEENIVGRDYALTDIHGKFDLFCRVFNSVITDDDRVFIAGDIFDRGEDSAALLDFILKINNDREQRGLAPQIYSIRGNDIHRFVSD